MRSPLWIATAGLIAATLPAPVGAQQPSVPTVSAPKDSRTTVYQAAYFGQFAPRTAFDIVQHVPGFQLDLGSTQSATWQRRRARFCRHCRQCGHQRLEAQLQGRDARRDFEANPFPTGCPRRVKPRRPVRIRLCGKKSGPQHYPVPGGGIRRRRHLLSDEALHRLYPAQSLRLGDRPAWSINLEFFGQHLGRNKKYEEGTDILEDPSTGRSPGVPPKAQRLRKSGSLYSRWLTPSSMARTTRTGSTFGGNRAHSTCSSATS